MRAQLPLSKVTVTDVDIAAFLRLRGIYEAQKKRMEMAEAALIEIEGSIMARIRAGAAVVSKNEVQLKTVERRNVPWKSVCSELIGAEATERILSNIEPSISYRLLVKAA